MKISQCTLGLRDEEPLARTLCIGLRVGVRAASERRAGGVLTSTGILLIICSACIALGADPALPDPHFTPGATMPGVTVQQVCEKGYANVLNGGVRNVPDSVKRQVFIEYFGKVPDHPGFWEIDHLCSLEIGGGNDPKNLWPEAYTNIVNGVDLGAHTKDKLEDRMAALLHADLKANGPAHATVLMHQFQTEIATNWISAYNKYCKTNQTK